MKKVRVNQKLKQKVIKKSVIEPKTKTISRDLKLNLKQKMQKST